MISQEALEAFQKLRDLENIEVTSRELVEDKEGAAMFTCVLPIPQNQEGLPERAVFEVSIPPTYPEGGVEFYPIDERIAGFPHQSFQVEKRRLCLLKSEDDYPWSPQDRLTAFVQSAIEWLEDAAHGQLLKKGQDWELPDFRIPSPLNAQDLIFLEDSTSFAVWRDRLGQFGKTDLAVHVHNHGLFPTRFQHGNDVAFSPNHEKGFIKTTPTYSAEWILLRSFVFERHRPPRTFQELETLCQKEGIDFWRSLKRSIKETPIPSRSNPVRNFHYLLIGSPIPKKVGGDLIEVYWQPVVLARDIVDTALKKNGGGHGGRASNEEQFVKTRLQEHLRAQTIPWGTSTNIGGDRLSVRGILSKEARGKNISLFGCGAIGSLVTEHLSRGGARSLSLFDGETLEFENLIRHSLGPKEVGMNKALAIAQKMQGLHPETKVTGFSESLPKPLNKFSAEAKAALERSEVWIDCTANTSAFRWLSKFGMEQGKAVIHFYINVQAGFLTILFSGTGIDCVTLDQKFREDITRGRTPFSMAEYFPKIEEELMPGAGCWHPTFPAKGYDVAALIAASIPIVERLLTQGGGIFGTVVVLKREEISAPLYSGPLIKVDWNKDYR